MARAVDRRTGYRTESILVMPVLNKAGEVYLERAEHFRANPPSAEWNGGWTMTSKWPPCTAAFTKGPINRHNPVPPPRSRLRESHIACSDSI